MTIEKDQKALRTIEEMRNIETNLIRYLDYHGKRNIKLSKCCNPQLNDPILAFITKEGTVTVHKADCPNIHTFENKRAIPMKWKQEDKTIKTIVISVKDRIGLIHEILEAAIETRVQILSIDIKTIKENLKITLKIKEDDSGKVKALVDAISKIPAVHSVKIHKKSLLF